MAVPNKAQPKVAKPQDKVHRLPAAKSYSEGAIKMAMALKGGS